MLVNKSKLFLNQEKTTRSKPPGCNLSSYIFISIAGCNASKFVKKTYVDPKSSIAGEKQIL